MKKEGSLVHSLYGSGGRSIAEREGEGVGVGEVGVGEEVGRGGEHVVYYLFCGGEV